MQRSLILAAAFACAASAIGCSAAYGSAVYAVDRGRLALRRVACAIVDFGQWLIAKLPKVRADWLGAWRQAPAHKDINPLSLQAHRRPLVSPRWRLCPSI